MIIRVNVTIESPEFIEAILALSKALAKGNLEESVSSIIEEEDEVKEVELNIVEEKEVIEKNEKEPAITLEEVRRVLATKSKNGKQVEVKEIIQRYGVKKLTDIHPCNYKELLELAEVL